MNARSLQVSPLPQPRVASPGSWARHAPLALEVLWSAAVLAGWLVLWMQGAATLPQPYAPDPETRAALVELQRDRAVGASGALVRPGIAAP